MALTSSKVRCAAEMAEHTHTPAVDGAPRKLGDFLRTGYLIHDVSRLRRQFYDQQSRHLGITRSQWWVLFNLARHEGDPLNQNALAEMLDLGSASVGELLLRLEKSGFIKRLADPNDRRSKRVVIAGRGREVLEHMRVVAQQNNALIMSGINPEEQEVLNGMLTRMKDNLASLQSAESNPGPASTAAETAAEKPLRADPKEIARSRGRSPLCTGPTEAQE